ncbi:hypothetical protein DMENIID0001_088670 [Sergentomyia squamirostris]
MMLKILAEKKVDQLPIIAQAAIGIWTIFSHPVKSACRRTTKGLGSKLAHKKKHRTQHEPSVSDTDPDAVSPSLSTNYQSSQIVVVRSQAKASTKEVEREREGQASMSKNDVRAPVCAVQTQAGGSLGKSINLPQDIPPHSTHQNPSHPSAIHCQRNDLLKANGCFVFCISFSHQPFLPSIHNLG